MNILIVEDEAEIAELIKLYLSKEGFNCHICRDGSTALEQFEVVQPDLMILDLMLPGLDGLEVCTRIRQQQALKDPYIMMLTAKGEEIDRIIGLSTGADDYMVKPFSPRELVARVRAVLRRSLRQGGPSQPQSQGHIYQTAHFMVDVDRRLAFRLVDQTVSKPIIMPRAGAEGSQNHRNTITLELTPLEFDLLTTFMSYPGRVWNRTQLIEKLWGSDFFGDERVVDAHIARLRKKVEPNSSAPSFIKTVVGVGYRFEDDPF
ncbi:MAG: response regulator transcription factor [Phormidesmis sp. RL_2_1]|nr:response regulator transcription factor [Phormidesmis sp. RL_2_1]